MPQETVVTPDGLDNFSLNRLMSPRALAGDAVVATGEWAWENRRPILGMTAVTLGAVALPGLLHGVTHAGTVPPTSESPDWIDTTLSIAEKLALPGLVGLGNAARVYGARKSEKDKLASQVKAMNEEIEELSKTDVGKIMEQAKAEGQPFTSEADAKKYLAIEAQKLAKSKAELSKQAIRYSAVGLMFEAGREFTEGMLFGVVLQSLPVVIKDFWKEYQAAGTGQDLPAQIEAGLKLAGWLSATTALGGIAWKTQDPGGKAGAQDKELYKTLRQKGMIK